MENKRKMDNGKHLILCVEVNKNDKLNSPGAIEEFLRVVVNLIGMTVIEAPKAIMFPFPDWGTKLTEILHRDGIKHPALEEAITMVNRKKTSESGCTGWCILAESHATVHTYPEKNQIYIDVFSCKDFDSEKVYSYVKSYFNARTIKIVNVPRGVFEYTNITQEIRRIGNKCEETINEYGDVIAMKCEVTLKQVKDKIKEVADSSKNTVISLKKTSSKLKSIYNILKDRN